MPPLRWSVTWGADAAVRLATIEVAEALGLADRSTAIAPATCGAAIEVPPKKQRLSLSGARPRSQVTVLVGTAELMGVPGANSVSELDTLESAATWSATPPPVRDVVTLPTLTADEMQAGAARAFRWLPFPAAITVKIP